MEVGTAAAEADAAATVEATAANNELCTPLSPGTSSTLSEPSSFRRVRVRGSLESGADFSCALPSLGAVAADAAAGADGLAGAGAEPCRPQAHSVTANAI